MVKNYKEKERNKIAYFTVARNSENLYRLSMINDQAIINALAKRLKDVGGYKNLSIESGISMSYLYDVLKGKRPASERIADYLGFKGVWVRKK